MAGSSTPLYYWDTCLFLAWIGDEQRPSGEMDGVREVIEHCKKRNAIILTSVVTTTEVLASKLPVGMDRLFADLMKRIQHKGVDSKIALLAHDLRNHYAVRAGEFNGKILSVPDSIHLATAIMYRANEFHTFDGSNGHNTLGLLPLSGDVAGHKLIICKPEVKNPGLDLRKPAQQSGQ
ncbi:MAG: PIN domain-containing protein [Alphaproteobacteria bacterium]|nr:PIN domain-containing protein [Alphaproteobacteria bacterium]